MKKKKLTAKQKKQIMADIEKTNEKVDENYLDQMERKFSPKTSNNTSGERVYIIIMPT